MSKLRFIPLPVRTLFCQVCEQWCPHKRAPFCYCCEFCGEETVYYVNNSPATKAIQ